MKDRSSLPLMTGVAGTAAMSMSRGSLGEVFAHWRDRREFTDAIWDDLEQGLLLADAGLRVTDDLLAGLHARAVAGTITDSDALFNALEAELLGRFADVDRSLRFEESGFPNVWVFIGANGVGKTATIGKVAAGQHRLGRTVLVAAGDTRAVAVEQLGRWAGLSASDIVSGVAGDGDPSSVIVAGIERAVAHKIDLVLVDAAGRVDNITELIDELGKVRRFTGHGNGRVTETLLVIDATRGPNGVVQAGAFIGAVVTRLSTRPGIVFSIEAELGVPVKLVGVGDTIDDLSEFDPGEFVGTFVQVMTEG